MRGKRVQRAAHRVQGPSLGDTARCGGAGDEKRVRRPVVYGWSEPLPALGCPQPSRQTRGRSPDSPTASQRGNRSQCGTPGPRPAQSGRR